MLRSALFCCLVDVLVSSSEIPVAGPEEAAAPSSGSEMTEDSPWFEVVPGCVARRFVLLPCGRVGTFVRDPSRWPGRKVCAFELSRVTSLVWCDGSTLSMVHSRIHCPELAWLCSE